MKRISHFSNDSGRITILVIGVAALSMLVSVVSLYLFVAAGRTMLPGPLAFRIAVSLPPAPLPAPPIPLPLAVFAEESFPQAAPQGETIADAGAQAAELGASIDSLGFAAAQPLEQAIVAEEPVVAAPVPEAPIPAVFTPPLETPDDGVIDDDSPGKSGSDDHGSGGNSGSNSGSGNGDDDDDDDVPKKPQKPDKPPKDSDKK